MDFSNKSIVVKKFGGYDVLEVSKFKLPKLDGLIEVKVHYCGLNFADLYTRLGLMPHELPFVLGMECSGIVTAIGTETTALKLGSRVICYNYSGGLYSDVIRIPVENCYVIPDEIELEEAAALFVNYLTAYFSLIYLGNLQRGQTVFIPACAGGVGWAATQICRTIKDVTIYGTSSANKQEQLHKNGVDHVLLYDNLETNLHNLCPDGFDLILETQSGTQRTILEQHLKPLGKIIFLGANSLIDDNNKISAVAMMKMWWSSKSIQQVDLVMKNRMVGGLHLGLLAEKEPGKTRDALNWVFAMMKDGIFKPKIDSVWDFEEIVEATKVLAERRNVGKVLLKLV